MNKAKTQLFTRKSELEAHLDLLRMLEAKLMSGDKDEGGLNVDVRHVRTVKSGLIIHLYNIIEATMTAVVTEVGEVFGELRPAEWNENILREWLRGIHDETGQIGFDKLLEQLVTTSNTLLKGAPLGALAIKKPGGSWRSKNIRSFMNRLSVDMLAPEELRQRAYGVEIARNDLLEGRGPLDFIAIRRNDIAHGVKTFEEGGQDLTMEKLSDYGAIVCDYLESIIESFEEFFDGRSFVKELT